MALRIAVGKSYSLIFLWMVCGCSGDEPNPDPYLVNPPSAKKTSPDGVSDHDYASGFRPKGVDALTDNIMEDYVTREKYEEKKAQLEREQARSISDARQREYEQRQAEEKHRKLQEREEELKRSQVRARYAREMFRSFPLTPNITLSPVLKAKGVTLEVRGKHYKQYTECVKDENWTELIRLATRIRPPDPPEEGDVDLALTRIAKMEFHILVRWKQDIDLFIISFPDYSDAIYSPFHDIRREQFFIKYGHSIGVKSPVWWRGWEKHPDGGYLIPWKPTDGPMIFIDAGNMRLELAQETQKRIEETKKTTGEWSNERAFQSIIAKAVHDKFNIEATNDSTIRLSRKYQLGELERTHLFQSLRHERDRLFLAILTWVQDNEM